MIRLYGISIGHGSLARVTAGMRGALAELGVLAGFVPIDAYDEETAYGGHDAAIGVYVGPPIGATILQTSGWHPERWVLLPPNSSFVPADMLQFLERHSTGLIAPTTWAEGVLSRYDTRLQVSVWRHGVDAGFRVNDEAHAARRDEYADGYFSVAHLASTARERKGTRELLHGWALAVRAGKLGTRPVLRLVVHDLEQKYPEIAEDAARGDPAIQRSYVFTQPRMNMDVATARAFYQAHHLVAQPSRGEAFGLVPLEARVCGVPIAATWSTGHGDHVHQGDPGVVVVRTGEDAPVDDGPGALDPSVRAEDIAAALIEAYEGWPELEQEAHRHAATLGQAWSWAQVTKTWLEGHA